MKGVFAAFEKSASDIDSENLSSQYKKHNITQKISFCLVHTFFCCKIYFPHRSNTYIYNVTRETGDNIGMNNTIVRV